MIESGDMYSKVKTSKVKNSKVSKKKLHWDFLQNGKESFYPHKILQLGFLDTFLEMSENPSISSIGIQSGILFQIKIQEYFLSFWS